MVKPVHVFMARTRVSKRGLKAELCPQRYVHFSGVPIYIFGFRHKQFANDEKDFILSSSPLSCSLALMSP